MTMKTMTASGANKELGRYLDAAQRKPVIGATQNRPVALAMSFQDREQLTKFRIERGLNHGLDDLKHGRCEEINDASTAARLVRFKDRNSSAP